MRCCKGSMHDQAACHGLRLPQSAPVRRGRAIPGALSNSGFERYGNGVCRRGYRIWKVLLVAALAMRPAGPDGPAGHSAFR